MFLVKFALFLLAEFFKKYLKANRLQHCLIKAKHFEENTAQSTVRESIFSLGKVILSLEICFVV